MQVVEVEEDNAAEQKSDIPLPSEMVKTEESQISHDAPKEASHTVEEKPDIASSFAAPIHETPVPVTNPEKDQMHTDVVTDAQHDVQPIKIGEKRDIVSELFESKKDTVTYPDISLDKKHSRFGFVIWVVALLAIVGLIGGGLIYLKGRGANEPVPSAVATSTPTPTLEETETPEPSTPSATKKTPTPTKAASVSATPKKTGLSIQVLNGSGIKGVASTMQKYLEEKGYNVVSTGNAKNFDYEKTEIIIKGDKTSFLEKLKTDLSGNYTVGSTSATLDAGATYDAQVIIGKE